MMIKNFPAVTFIIHHSSFTINVLLLSCLSVHGLAAAGEAETDTGETPQAGKENKEAEKPKEQPFKYSVWCAFRDLSTDYLEPKKDSHPYETRPISTKWMGFGRRG